MYKRNKLYNGIIKTKRGDSMLTTNNLLTRIDNSLYLQRMDG